MEKFVDVFCMCNALFDLQAEVSESTLSELSLTKGGMFLLSHEEQAAIVPRVYTDIVNTDPGGSGANTAIGIALLGGTASFTSRVGADEHGKMYRSGLEEKGVTAYLGVAESGAGDTGVSLILVTDDAQRTMCTYLGQAQSLRAEDVNADAIRASKYIYVTGFLWDTESQKAAVLHAMEIARAAGVPISLSLSDSFCVGRHKDDFRRLLGEYVDAVFANSVEARQMTDTDDDDAATAALVALLRPDGERIAAVTRDKAGSILLRGGDEKHAVPAYPVEAVDTTGAGDMYAAGVLYGLTHGLSLPESGRIGAYTAAQVVARMGPRLDQIDPAAIANLRD